MTAILVLIGLLGLAVGALMLTEATMGVGIIAGAACLFILARIVQAEAHTRKLLQDKTQK